MSDENEQIIDTDIQKPAPEAAKPDAKTDDLNIAPKPAAPVAEQPVAYAATGDAAMDVALDFFSKAGIKPDSPAAILAQKGDFSVLKAELAAKQKPGWEGYVAIAEQAYGRATSAAQTAAAATKAVILQVAGSQEDWDAIRTFIGEKADASELEDLNASIKRGGVSARAAVRYMKEVFLAGGGKLGGDEPEPESIVPTARGRVPQSGGPMSAAEYNAAVQALSAKIGAAKMDASPEYAALRQRRQAALR